MRDEGLVTLDRRQFIMRAAAVAILLPTLPLGCSASLGSDQTAARTTGLEGGGAADAPANLSWQTTMVSADEPGEPLIVSGTIFQPDGATPASGVMLYVYHTDARGYYSERDGDGGPPRPRLKGWMKTGPDGRYEFRTIVPASYPGSRNPAHIHGSLSGPSYPERWIEEFWFEDDAFITTEMRSKVKGTGRFSPILTLRRGEDGVRLGTRDFKLEQR
jgi:protocatechuate 3,4-dioxygenase, beta subunit